MDRYKRIIELGWDITTLKQATILVIGAGALGNEVLKNLALLGVGNILVVDMDVIEDHNLTRSILFRQTDISQPKALVAAKRVREIDPSINIKAFVDTVQNAFGLGVYQTADIVFGCLDNIQARIDVNRSCYLTNTLYIDAGLRKIDGDVKVFGPPYDICLDCGMTQRLRDEAWRRFSCLKLRTRVAMPTAPTAPTISSIMAGFQVQIGIKYLHEAPIPIGSRISVLGYIDDITVSKMSANPNCPTHNLYSPIPEKEVIELKGSYQTLTLGELITKAKHDLGLTASIQLDFDLLTYFECPIHQHQKQLLRKRGSVFADEIECPECKKEGLVASHLIMQEYFTNQIDGTESSQFLNYTLKEIGIPPYHLIQAKAMQEHKMVYRFYKIMGDKSLFF